MLGAVAQATDDKPNRVTPMIKALRRPKISPAAPPRSSRALSGNRYAFTTHCSWMASAPKVVPMAGRPTFTTEPSMNAKLEARIVVTIRNRGRCVIGAVAVACAAEIIWHRLETSEQDLASLSIIQFSKDLDATPVQNQHQDRVPFCSGTL